MTPFLFHIDGYKMGHHRQFPSGTTRVLVNFTPRNGRSPLDKGVIAFGLQYLIDHYLIEVANQTFFNRAKIDVVAEYAELQEDYLGPGSRDTKHIEALHDLGFLPINIKAVPEGTFVPYGVPMLTIENTIDEFYWLPNYIETLLSTVLWLPCTSATTAFKYRHQLEHWARTTGSALEFVDWQGHDFSFRGMEGPEAAMISGAAHLLSFTGTDTVPALGFLRTYYNGKGLLGGSVPATEHSVMCAGGKESELDTFDRLLSLYPSGILSVVSDTWNLWDVLQKILPALYDKIMARSGKLVIRPDSGDPVKIICGDPGAPVDSPERRGVVGLLYDLFGGTETETGHILLDSHIGVIYGDSITPERCEAICQSLSDNGFASGNVVFGIGSFTYQYVTRDTHGFAMKATWAIVDGEQAMLFKQPITDNGGKFSARGRMIVERGDDGRLRLVDGLTMAQWALARHDRRDVLRTVFADGTVIYRADLAEVRDLVRSQVGKIYSVGG